MDPPGFEPGASALQGQRSPSLSYGPKSIDFVETGKQFKACNSSTTHKNSILSKRR